MIKKVHDKIYTFPVTLPKSPLRSINIYVIKDKKRNFVLDTGYNSEESLNSMKEGLAELDLEIKDVDLILTHLHSDHTGLAAYFKDNGSKVYASKIDGEQINLMAEGPYWEIMDNLVKYYGIKKNEIKLDDNPGYKYRMDHKIDIDILNIGDIIDTGTYKFEVLDLMGHTPGHIGLFDKDKKILFCGDTILETISPNITFWGYEYDDILGTYLNTLRSLREKDVKYCFSTHRDYVENHKKRIDELIKHHYLRLQEILDSMNLGEEYTIRDISPRITWRIRAKSWDDFPPAQKYFASGETMSHVEHLVFSENLERQNKDGVMYYKKTKEKYDTY